MTYLVHLTFDQSKHRWTTLHRQAIQAAIQVAISSKDGRAYLSAEKHLLSGVGKGSAKPGQPHDSEIFSLSQPENRPDRGSTLGSKGNDNSSSAGKGGSMPEALAVQLPALSPRLSQPQPLPASADYSSSSVALTSGTTPPPPPSFTYSEMVLSIPVLIYLSAVWGIVLTFILVPNIGLGLAAHMVLLYAVCTMLLSNGLILHPATPRAVEAWTGKGACFYNPAGAASLANSSALLRSHLPGLLRRLFVRQQQQLSTHSSRQPPRIFHSSGTPSASTAAAAVAVAWKKQWHKWQWQWMGAESQGSPLPHSCAAPPATAHYSPVPQGTPQNLHPANNQASAARPSAVAGPHPVLDDKGGLIPAALSAIFSTVLPTLRPGATHTSRGGSGDAQKKPASTQQKAVQGRAPSNQKAFLHAAGLPSPPPPPSDMRRRIV